MRHHFSLFFISLLVRTFFLAAPLAAEDVLSQSKELSIKLIDKNFFTDRIATALIQHAQPLTLHSDAPFTDSQLKLINVSSHETKQKNSLLYQTRLRFLPQKTGSLQFPALRWKTAAGLSETRAIDFKVDTPQESSAMQLSIQADKTEVFVGEPLKISLKWTSSLDINRLQELKLYPDFFNMEGIEVVIPRSTAPPDAQIGLPLGGRRILAHRESPSPLKLGTIQLDLFLRFHESGKFKFTASRLECGLIASSKRKFAPYAAHFNNAFFERLDTSLIHQRIFVDSEPFEIHVRDLPPNTSEHPFTGLFTPINFTAQIPTNEVTVGQLIPLHIHLDSHNTPHEWLKLAQSHIYDQVKGHFWSDQSPNHYWRVQGSRYETRLRALSTQVKAIPELEFLCFDAASESYHLKTSPSVPIDVRPANGQNFIPLNTFMLNPPPLSRHNENVWYPLPSSPLSKMINSYIVFANQHFGMLLSTLIGLFIVMLSFIHYSRKQQQTSGSVRASKQAYRRFQKKPIDHPEKWLQFLDFLALSLQLNTASMTKEEVLRALQKLHLEATQLTEIERFFHMVEERTYSPRPHKINFKTLEPIAKVISKRAHLLGVLALSLTAYLLPTPLEASPWNVAQQALNEAELAEPGSQTARLLYTKAALQFESIAQDPYVAAEAYSHAGHAWFQAQALGRALAAYRIAYSYRPFDVLIKENISSIRASISSPQSARSSDPLAIPTRWLRAILILILILFCISLLLRLRYRYRLFLWSTFLSAACLMFMASLLMYRACKPLQVGVVIARKTEARKGPGYQFTPAFNAAVQEGMEFQLIHEKKDWCFVHLHDASTCWLHRSQIQTFEL